MNRLVHVLAIALVFACVYVFAVQSGLTFGGGRTKKISKGEEVDIYKHLGQERTLVEFTADW